MANNTLQAFDHQGTLVVDSRLIAERLGIAHENFIETVRKYQSDAEEAFGSVTFQTGQKTGTRSGGSQPKWALLTEDHATFYMSLSRNTPEVVRCKIELVKAFRAAKELLQRPANRFHDKLDLAPFWYQRQVQFLADNKVPAGYFSIFGETITLVAELETAGYTLPDSSIPDISIGKCWANYLRKEARIDPDSISVMYPHKYPNYAYPVDAKAYSEDYLPQFRRWFRNTYKTVKLPAYFRGKDSAALPAVAKLLGLPAGVTL